jgi:hypothetical protein
MSETFWSSLIWCNFWFKKKWEWYEIPWTEISSSVVDDASFDFLWSNTKIEAVILSSGEVVSIFKQPYWAVDELHLSNGKVIKAHIVN